MSLVTISSKRARVYHRAFDHDEARRLHAEDPRHWTYTRLADRYGVSCQGVRRVLDNEVNRKMGEYSLAYARRHYRAPCKGGCGTLVWAAHRKGRTGYCTQCVAKTRAPQNVRPSELRCSRCGEWKPDAEFYRRSASVARRGRTTLCKPCSAIERREFRHKHPEQALEEGQRAARARRERRTMSRFVILRSDGPETFRVLGRVDAATASHAVERFAQEAGEYIAVPEGKLRALRVAPVQAFRVVREADAPSK